MNASRLAAAGALVGLVLTASAAAAATHIYSYDPADAATKEAAGPLTFEVRKALIGPTKVVNLRSTVAAADADLKRAADRDLGPGGLAALIGARGPEHQIYEIEPAEQGAALISALCPGAKRAWLAFSGFGFNEPLKIAVLGLGAAPAKTRVCRTLSYDFHGEWSGPPTTPVLQDGESLMGRSSGPSS
jgi:hypothetical protein